MARAQIVALVLPKRAVTIMTLSSPSRPCILVEGPTWGNAELYGNWLLAAARAEYFWKEAQQDPEFNKQVERVCLVYVADFALAASVMIMQLKEYRTTFLIDLHSEEAEEFTMMALMGFFHPADRRYKFIVPPKLTAATVRDAILRFALTEDEEFALHPECFVCAMSFTEARACQERIRAIDEFHANARSLGHA